jgi:ferric-dicitrate binding protein FerR (iron transport regulator)
MVLPDGSIIFLNSDSRIRYSIDGEKGVREVFLDGEAWFDVEKNKKKPFVVHTPFYDVNVTGTQFNVKAYEADRHVTTTLEEGQVVIHSTENYQFTENVVLKPGEQIVLNKDSQELVLKEVNTKWYTSWKDNKLIFVNMDMKDLIVLLERKYGVDIEVKNKAILDLHFDGTLKNETIIEILDIIKKTLPINYKIVGQKIEITSNK